MSISVTTAA